MQHHSRRGGRMASVFILLGLLSGCDLLDALGSTSDGSEELLSESFVQMFEQQIDVGGYPAIVVGVIDGDASRVYGFGKVGSGVKPDGETLFEIGSLTKTFTGLLLADAVVSNEVSLDEPVQNLVPDFQIPTYNLKPITLETLATHYSGLPRMPNNMAPYDRSNLYAAYDAGKLSSFLTSHTLSREPGASYEYSNLAFGLLGYALGEQAGSDWEELLKTKVFEPLEMSSSYSAVADAPVEQLAVGHNADGEPVPNWDFMVLNAAGSIVSGADDLLRYLRANMGHVESSLYPAMLLAHEPRVARSEYARVGLAWVTSKSRGDDIVWHGGQTAGYRTYIGFYKDGSRGIVILTNLATPDPVTALGMLSLQDGKNKQVIDMNGRELDEYVGIYELENGDALTVFREKARLFMQERGKIPVQIFPSAADYFFSLAVAVKVEFKRDAPGDVVELVLRQGDDEQWAPRIE